jgi:hypothetical protein
VGMEVAVVALKAAVDLRVEVADLLKAAEIDNSNALKNENCKLETENWERLACYPARGCLRHPIFIF